MILPHLITALRRIITSQMILLANLLKANIREIVGWKIVRCRSSLVRFGSWKAFGITHPDEYYIPRVRNISQSSYPRLTLLRNGLWGLYWVTLLIRSYGIFGKPIDALRWDFLSKALGSKFDEVGFRELLVAMILVIGFLDNREMLFLGVWQVAGGNDGRTVEWPVLHRLLKGIKHNIGWAVVRSKGSEYLPKFPCDVLQY